jgi:hypothetical protein
MQTIPSVAVLTAMASQQLAAYPQYANYHAGWVRAQVNKDVKTKLGLAFRKGDVVLVDPKVRDLTGQSFAKRKELRSVTAYSFRNKVHTSVWLSDVTFIDPLP